MSVGAIIMIVDDDLQDRGVHSVTLGKQGYKVLTAGDAEETLGKVAAEIPDLFLISCTLGEDGTEGFTLCQKLKEDLRLKQVPVVFISESRSPEILDRGFEVGGVDTIVKPCHLNEFLARVRIQLEMRNLLHEVQMLREADIDANPLTHLPGNNSITAAIQEAIDRKQDMVVIYTDLDNFKAYNDAYGFSAGDDVLLFNAETLQTALRLVTPRSNFLGHVGGDDFVIIVPAEKAQQVGDKIVQLFDEGAPTFYTADDLAAGGITGCDRRGSQQHFPIMGISMGGVRLLSHDFSRFVEVAEICAEVKHAAKNVKGSNLFMDRRGKLAPDQAQESADREPALATD